MQELMKLFLQLVLQTGDGATLNVENSTVRLLPGPPPGSAACAAAPAEAVLIDDGPLDAFAALVAVESRR